MVSISRLVEGSSSSMVMPTMMLSWPASAFAMESSLAAACLSRATKVLASMSCADLESWFMASFSA